MKLLIVEDHAGSAEALCKLLTLRMETLHCVIVGTLREGLEKSMEIKAGVTLLDLSLPDATIDQVIESIPKFYPPVVVISDFASPEIVLKCFQFEAENVLTKCALRKKIDSFEGRIEADKLVMAITNAHFRDVLPKTRHAAPN